MNSDEGDAPSPQQIRPELEIASKAAWRLRAYPSAVLIGLGIGFAIFVITADGASGRWGRLGGDFPAFYSAGRIVAAGDVHRLYSLDRQRFEQTGLFPGSEGRFLPFVYPPFVAAAYAPISTLSYRVAYVCHSAFMLVCLLVAIAVLRQSLPTLRRWPLVAVFTAALLFHPMLRAIVGGQNTAISLLILALTFALARLDRDLLAGICLGFLVFKPQFAVIFIGLFLLERRWRLVIGAAATALVLYFAGAAIAGANWPAWWWNDAVIAYRGKDQALNFDTGISWLNAAEFFLRPADRAAMIVGAILSIATAMLVGWVFLRGERRDLAERLAFATSAALLISPHTLFYDAGLLLLPLAVLVEIRGAARAAPWLIGAWLLSWSQVAATALRFAPTLAVVLLIALLSGWIALRSAATATGKE